MPVPEERSLFGQLNTIYSLIESTCDDKWEVLIETALPAAGHALYLLIIPDIGEILENYLQPRARRGDPKRAKRGYGARRGTRHHALRWWQRIGFPDIDSIIAQHLPGVDLIQGRNAGAAERWLWNGIDILDRLSWYWMLLDLTDNFIAEWSSGIVESRFCTASWDALFVGDIQREHWRWDTYAFPPSDKDQFSQLKGWEVSGGGRLDRILGAPQAQGTITFTVHCTPLGLVLNRQADIRIRAVASSLGGTQTTLLSETIHIDKNTTTIDLSLSGPVPPCFRINFGLERLAGFLFQTEPYQCQVTGFMQSV